MSLIGCHMIWHEATVLYRTKLLCYHSDRIIDLSVFL